MVVECINGTRQDTLSCLSMPCLPYHVSVFRTGRIVNDRVINLGRGHIRLQIKEETTEETERTPGQKFWIAILVAYSSSGFYL